jgi:polysaccharide export outer membrane protein
MELMMDNQTLSFFIVRGGDNGETFQASPATRLEPGDVLEVRLDFPEMAAGTAPSAPAASVNLLSR